MAEVELSEQERKVELQKQPRFSILGLEMK